MNKIIKKCLIKSLRIGFGVFMAAGIGFNMKACYRVFNELNNKQKEVDKLKQLANQQFNEGKLLLADYQEQMEQLVKEDMKYTVYNVLNIVSTVGIIVPIDYYFYIWAVAPHLVNWSKDQDEQLNN